MEEQTNIIYVNQAATGENDGTSWDNAYTNLQDAIANSRPNDEVWVAAGVYRPTTDGDREISFQPTEFVQFYGGFAGNETERSQRDVEANQTTLSGNIGDLGDPTDNSYHVVDITGTSATTVLDGFVIRGGYADDFGNFVDREPDFGGGIYSAESGNATLNNLTILDNYAVENGGGIYLSDSSNPEISNTLITNNEATLRGGGLNSIESSPSLTEVTFQGNIAGDDGGGISNDSGNPVLNRVIFDGNTAGDAGGGLINFDSDSSQTTNSLFVSNQSQRGGAVYNQDSNDTINNSTFVNNQSDFGGGVFASDFSSSGEESTTINNSIFVNNFGALDELQIADNSEDDFNIVNNSIVEGGYEGGANILDVNPRFINPEEGNFQLRSNSPGVDVGSNGAIDAEFDLAGEDRIINDTVDLGAYEFQDDLPEGTVYRLFNPEVGVHFYTSDRSERNSVIEDLPNYEYEGASFQTITEEEADSLTGARPVFRFFNVDTGVHLYTINEAERDAIRENLPNFEFEGASYFAYDTQQEGTIPLYRFFDPEIGAHFYTPLAGERDAVVENLPGYELEGDGGVAFYVEPLVE